MRKLIIVGILVMVVAMAAPAMAFEKGTIRLGAGTGFTTSSLDFDAGGSIDADLLMLDFGYFLTDSVEIAFQYASDGLDLGGGLNIDTVILGLAGKYYIPVGENTVYVGGGFQTIEYDFGLGGTADGDAIFVTGGYNYMLKDYFSIDFYLTLGQGDVEGDDFDSTDIGITYSVYFE